MSEAPNGREDGEEASLAGGARPQLASHPRSWRRAADGTLPLIIGHRGASALEPENSIAAFERAAADGADGVELDVLLCATGEVIVFHDDDLSRLGEGARRIAEMSLVEVRNVRLRSGAALPTLDEVLVVCGPRLLINIELKASGLTFRQIAALVDRVDTVVANAAPGTSERVLISSFNPLAVNRWRRRAPHVPAGLLFERDAPLPLRRAWALPWLRPFSVHPEKILCTPAHVARWHRSGYRVAVWTVDDPSELRRFAAMGIDAIITNDPAAARRALSAGLREPAQGRML